MNLKGFITSPLDYCNLCVLSEPIRSPVGKRKCDHVPFPDFTSCSEDLIYLSCSSHTSQSAEVDGPDAPRCSEIQAKERRQQNLCGSCKNCSDSVAEEPPGLADIQCLPDFTFTVVLCSIVIFSAYCI